MALLYLLSEMARQDGSVLHVATVDHGLRPEARDEALQVGKHAEALGHSHDILTWRDPAAEGNLQGEARAARYRLLAEWSRARGAASVAVGHTADDQAETVLMRLRRASGVEGLAAMAVRHRRDGMEILRPMLGLRRATLRAYLEARGVDWCEDPSNRDTRFERIRMREAMASLAPLGLTVEALATVAENMQVANAALATVTAQAAASLGEVRLGAVRLAREGFGQLQDEIARRLLIAALRHVTEAVYAPRRDALADALREIKAGRGVTLHGCQILLKSKAIWIVREYSALRDQQMTDPEGEVVWDSSWRLTLAAQKGVTLRALGADGLRHLENWRDLAVPREVLLPLPSLWCGGKLLLVPPLLTADPEQCAAIRTPDGWASGALSD